jgi:hypothetical protein
MAVNITTAVDSLVKLVNKEGKISIEDASKELGLPQNIINEWATFLDQERIIHLEYKFTTPYLIAKGKELSSENTGVDYEYVIRKLEIMQSYLLKSNPKEEKKIRQKQYLLKEAKKVIELTRRKKITKEQLAKLVKYYRVFKRG